MSRQSLGILGTVAFTAAVFVSGPLDAGQAEAFVDPAGRKAFVAGAELKKQNP